MLVPISQRATPATAPLRVAPKIEDHCVFERSLPALPRASPGARTQPPLALRLRLWPTLCPGHQPLRPDPQNAENLPTGFGEKANTWVDRRLSRTSHFSSITVIGSHNARGGSCRSCSQRASNHCVGRSCG